MDIEIHKYFYTGNATAVVTEVQPTDEMIKTY